MELNEDVEGQLRNVQLQFGAFPAPASAPLCVCVFVGRPRRSHIVVPTVIFGSKNSVRIYLKFVSV